MPLKLMRQEVELLAENLFSTQPDLEFILNHVEALQRHAMEAARGGGMECNSPEDQEMIRRYYESAAVIRLPNRARSIRD